VTEEVCVADKEAVVEGVRVASADGVELGVIDAVELGVSDSVGGIVILLEAEIVDEPLMVGGKVMLCVAEGEELIEIVIDELEYEVAVIELVCDIEVEGEGVCEVEGEEVCEVKGEGVGEVDTLGVIPAVGVSVPVVVATKKLNVGDAVAVTLAGDVSDPDGDDVTVDVSVAPSNVGDAVAVTLTVDASVSDPDGDDVTVDVTEADGVNDGD
jgi:hypothetical protein